MWSPDRREKVNQHQELIKKRALTAPNNKKNKYRDDINSSGGGGALPPVRGVDTNSSSAGGGGGGYSARTMALKVRAQRLERLKRDEEESELQLRVNEHLCGILAKHKQQKKEMMDRWKSHANAPMPPPPAPPAVVRARLAEEEDQKKQDKLRRERARESTKMRLQRGAMLPRSAVGGGSEASSAMMTPNASNLFPGQLQPGSFDSSTSGDSEAAKANARHAAAFAEVSQIYEGVFRQQQQQQQQQHGGAGAGKESVSAMLSDFIPTSIQDLTEHDDYGPLLVGLSPEQKRRLKEIEAKHQKTKAKIAAKEAMFERAKQRREVAAQRIKDDPPADVLVQADLRRYIPADLLEAMPSGDRNNGLPPGFDASAAIGGGGGGAGGGGASFFLTDVDAEKKRQEVEENEQNQQDSGGRDKKKRKKSVGGGTRSKAQMQKQGTAKARALLGGPLEIGAENNKRMSIFAREILMKVSTTKKMREEAERAKKEQEGQLIQARREALGNDNDDDSEFDDSTAGVATNGGVLHRQHAPTGLDPEAERRAQVEWYRRYHQSLVQGGNIRGVGRQGAVLGDWKANHKPLPNLPMPSRTLFFESERAKVPLRGSLF